MKAESAKKKILMVVNILIYLVSIGAIVFMSYELKKMYEQNTTNRTKITSLDLETAGIKDLVNGYAQVKASSEKLASSVPDKDHLLDFVKQIEILGRACGLSINVGLAEGTVNEQGVVVEKPTDSTKKLISYFGVSGVETLEIGVVVRGDVRKVMNFITLLNTIEYYSQVTSIKVRVIEGERGTEQESILTLLLYVKSGKTK